MLVPKPRPVTLPAAAELKRIRDDGDAGPAYDLIRVLQSILARVLNEQFRFRPPTFEALSR